MASPTVDMYMRAVERFQAGDYSGMADQLADDVVWHEAGNPEPLHGKDAVLQRMTTMGPDVQNEVTVRSAVGDDEHVMVHGHAKFQRDGETCEYDYVEEMELRDGRIVERWSFMDAVPDDVARFFANA